MTFLFWAQYYFDPPIASEGCITKKSRKSFDLQDSAAEREGFLSTLFSTPPLKSLRRLWHYDTRFLLLNKSVAIVFCLSSHCLCIMFINCPYERGIILHHDHYLTIIIQMPISQIWLWKLYLHVAILIFKMLHNFYRHWNM